MYIKTFPALPFGRAVFSCPPPVLHLVGEELPDDLLPPVPTLIQRPQVLQAPVMVPKQAVQEGQLRIVPRL